MRVALFADVDTVLNPYILLYKKTLELEGIAVDLEPRFGLNWLIAKGQFYDAIHLHWIEANYRPSRWKTRSRLVNKLMNNRFALPLRGFLRLTNFSLALVLAKLQRKVTVYTTHDLKTSFEEALFSAVLRHAAHFVVLSLVDRIHVHNQYTRQILETDYKRKEGVAVVPLGNYIGRYSNQISRSEARYQLALPGNAFVYLFLGLLRPYKGVEELVDAFGKLEPPRGRLLIVGHALDGQGFKEKVIGLCRNDPDIKLIPEFVPDEAVQLYMNACDVCVLPYRYITTSSAAVLALSFGRPIVVPAITSFPELITPEVGVLYDPSRPGALVSALQQAQQQSWSEAKILDYVHRFDWDKLGPQLVALYQTESDGKSHSW